MKNVANTIEDLIEIASGLQNGPKIVIDPSDMTIMHSIARQVFKGTALTDRQYDVVKQKLIQYKGQFDYLEDSFDLIVDNLRMPLRELDRSRWIRIVDHLGEDSVYETSKSPFIAVRFSFQKKLISSLEHIDRKIGASPYHYNKITKVKYYEYSERNLYEIVTAFKDKNFVLDDTVLELYNQITSFEKQDHLPGIYNYKFLNVHPNCEKSLNDELGVLSEDNILLFKDRSLKYGLYVDNVESSSVLTQNIANRKTTKIFVNNQKWNLDQLVNSLVELDRFPIAILLDENDPYNDLTESYNAFKNVVAPNQVSVQFRLSSEHSNGFNEYVKHNRLNSSVDKNTKVVYTSIDKLNKPLMTSECNPQTILLLESRRTGLRIQPWLDSVDLVIHYDENISQFMRFQRETLTEV